MFGLIFVIVFCAKCSFIRNECNLSAGHLLISHLCVCVCDPFIWILW